jgi:secreted trypsin-like serine protease
MRTTCIVAAVVIAALLPTQASAITNGQPDGGAHPYVALMQTYDEHNVPLQVCSGSVVSPTLFLTAGHCVAEPKAAHAELFFDEAPQIDIDYLLALFLDPNFDGSCDYSPAFNGYPCFGDAGGTPHAYPDFCFECGSGIPNRVNRDVAVVTLDKPVPAGRVSRYAQLPAAGQADSLANRAPLDLVGYGVQEQLQLPGKYVHKPPPFFRWAGAGQRMRATSELVAGDFAQSDEFLRFTLNADDAGSGGTCFGDSGGPDLMAGTDTVLAVNSYLTNYNCAGVGYSQRVDVPDVLTWIASFGG